MSHLPTLLAYFGHHKSASTWIHTILGHVCDETGLSSAYLANEGMFEGDLRGWLATHDVDLLCYVNADWRHVSGLPPYRGFHVVRDPRDILTSAYFSHLHSHKTAAWPALVEHRERLKQVDAEQGLMLELDFNADVLGHMATWNYEQEDVLELKMEELVVDPLNGFLEIFRFLDLIDEEHYGKKEAARYLLKSAANVLRRHHKVPVGTVMPKLPAERLLGIVHDNRFDRVAGGRKAGQESVTSHYRKGVAGDWKNHFTPRHVAAFKQRWNDLLLTLGYETDPDWGV